MPQNCWSPPPEGWIKINTDGAKSLSSHDGVGSILRDFSERILAASSAQIPPLSSSIQAELAAIFHGIQFAVKLNLDNVEIESDALLAVSALKTSNTFFNEVGLWINNILSLLKSVNSFRFLHCKRSCNVVADKLASMASSFFDPEFWQSDYPRWLSLVAMKDQRCNSPSS